MFNSVLYLYLVTIKKKKVDLTKKSGLGSNFSEKILKFIVFCQYLSQKIFYVKKIARLLITEKFRIKMHISPMIDRFFPISNFIIIKKEII